MTSSSSASTDAAGGPIWAPSPERAAATRIAEFGRRLREQGLVDAFRGEALDYPVLHRFSVEQPEVFWPEVWGFTGLIADGEGGVPRWNSVVRGLERMSSPDAALGPVWFEGARLNFAENLLRRNDDAEALVSWTEEGRRASMTFRELRAAVAGAAAALAGMGVGAGDRVAGFMPNIIETVVAMLAATSRGAIWSSCSPDFGIAGVLDRFSQIAPRVLFCSDGYRYGARLIPTVDRVRAIVSALPAIERVVVVRLTGSSAADVGSIRGAVTWDDWIVTGKREPVFNRLPFDHPLYIMYSSGTTGLPKCMVHGAGGTLLQHQKEHVLHTDIRAGDRVFYFTTCGWMMWNWLTSALAVGATVVLYDGSPMAASTGTGSERDLIWQMAEREQLTVFGTSARYLAAAEREGLKPRRRNLESLRTILSTGSPLSAGSFDWVYREVKGDVQLSSISGGTDIISCFVLGNPAGPVWRGELQVPGLGMEVDVFDSHGRPLPLGQGELVCRLPFPSMPVAFWNDPDGRRYQRAYFERFAGAWCHGDWAEFTPHGGMVITGRSDATLNPGGVRIGTAEIYRQLEQIDEVTDSVVVGQDGDGDVRVVLFVRLRDGLELDDALRDRIKQVIRANASPHHVPRVILQVGDVPRTISGKVTELAVREVIHGREVKNLDALANPDALEYFRDRRELES
ncbi:MAG: acetoacetate--CoA ligase [Gemmatimonadota bacterium]